MYYCTKTELVRDLNAVIEFLTAKLNGKGYTDVTEYLIWFIGISNSLSTVTNNELRNKEVFWRDVNKRLYSKFSTQNFYVGTVTPMSNNMLCIRKKDFKQMLIAEKLHDAIQYVYTKITEQEMSG